MKKISHVLLALALLSSFPLLVNAEEAVDSITGVSYELDENGNFARLRATGEAELKIGDRRDITTAKQKATLRAKANIAKFLNERLTSEEVMSNAEKMLSTTDGQNTKVNRETVEDYLEKIQVNAEAILKGIITVKEDINTPEKYVQIEVGYSPKTQGIADTISGNLNKDFSNTGTPNGGVSATGERKINKAKNYDSF